MHERERHRIILDAVAGKACGDRAGFRRRDRRLRGDDPARSRGARRAQRRLRRLRGGAEALQPPSSSACSAGRRGGNETGNAVAEARHRPRSRRTLRGRRADHHQWRHHHLPDGACPDRLPHAGAHQFLPDRRAPAAALEMHGLPALAARSIASRTSSCSPSRTTGPRISTRAACSWARRASRALGIMEGDALHHPGRAAADAPGRRVGPAGRFHEIPGQSLDDPVRPWRAPHRIITDGGITDEDRQHGGDRPGSTSSSPIRKRSATATIDIASPESRAAERGRRWNATHKGGIR